MYGFAYHGIVKEVGDSVEEPKRMDPQTRVSICTWWDTWQTVFRILSVVTVRTNYDR